MQSNQCIHLMTCAALVLSLVLVNSILADGTRTSKSQPNILLIVADDMGYSDIGCFGGEIATPTLDRLATEGLRFSNFHVLPTCSPTRSVLLSGTDNHVAGLGTMGEMLAPAIKGKPGYEGYLNFNVGTLPEVLRSGGYHTYMAGKWHLGTEEKTGPHARGFEETFILAQGGGSHWHDQRPLSPTQPMTYRRNGKHVKELPDDFYSTRYYTDRLLEFLKKNESDEKPFFAYLAYTAPHDPLHAPREYIAKYKGNYDQGWDVLRDRRLAALKKLGIVPKQAVSFPGLPNVPAWKDMSIEQRQLAARDMEIYAAMIDYMDEQILRVVDYLKQTGQYENTMIVFFSDNGANGHPQTAYPGQTDEHLKSFENQLENRGLANSFIVPGPGWSQASMTPSRLFKGVPSEGGIKSPLIVKLPGKMPSAGQWNHSFFHVRDVMPTFLDAADICHPKSIGDRKVAPMQGQSVLDLWASKSEVPYATASQVGYELFGLKAFFDGDWKILHMPAPYGKGKWELFNLKQDPAEMNDLSKKLPQRLSQMVDAWEQYKRDNGVLNIQLESNR